MGLTVAVGAMNDPEVTTLEPPANQLIALTTALEAASLALTLARRVPAPLKSLADQVRAMTWRLLYPRA